MRFISICRYYRSAGWARGPAMRRAYRLVVG